MAAEPAHNDHALFPITVRDKYGAINRAGEVVIPPEYDEPIALREGLARTRKGPRVAYLDTAGKRVIEPQERTAELFSQGMAPARGLDAKGVMRHGYVSRTGEWAIEPRFADAKAFSASRAAVGIADEWGRVKYGYIDATGSVVIEPRFERAFTFGRVARVEIDKRPRLIDRDGNDVTPADIDSFGPESGGMMLARKGKLIGYLNDEGKLVIEPRFTSAYDFKEGMARFWEQGKFGFIDRAGKIAAPPRFDSAGDFHEGVAYVRIDGKYGYIDKSGKITIPVQFERVQPFSDGVAAAQREKLWGFIDRKGQWIIEPRFQWAREFRNGLAWVGEPKQRGGMYIDKKGAVVWRTPE
jgi:WG containing repeat